MHALQLTGLAAFAFAAVASLFGWRKGMSGRALLLALVLSTLWVGSLATAASPWLDLARSAAWLVFLVRVAGLSSQALIKREHPTVSMVWGAVAALVSVAVLLGAQNLTSMDLQRGITFAWLAVALAGLVLVEQLLRNTLRRRVWSFKFIPLGVGILFGSDFLFHADSMLFGQPSPDLALARPLLQIFALPLLLVGSLRSRDQQLHHNLTREPALHTAVLTIAGGYLVLQSGAAMYLRLFGGEWNKVLLFTLATAFAISLVVVLASSSLRARTVAGIRQLLGLSRYDYRSEWMQLNAALAKQSADESYEETVLAALLDLTQAKRGMLLRVNGSATLPVLSVVANYGGPPDPEIDQAIASEVLAFSLDTDWVPQAAGGPGANAHPGQPTGVGLLCADFDTTMVLPLRLRDHVWGFAVLGERLTPGPLKTEDFDLFRIAARQMTGALAANALSRDLAEAEQLTAASQMTSFLLHDLKTIVSQLSLLPQNAKRHRTNPAFVDDMVTTIDHAVGKMHRLVQQLSSDNITPANADAARPVAVAELLGSVVAGKTALRPAPRLDDVGSNLVARANEADLKRVLEHLLHNAADASASDGDISVSAELRNGMVCIHVADTGSGMPEAFIRDGLFRPFSSTKGVSGMGIGTYQSRQLVRAMGGDITVQSKLGQGSRFTVRLPPAASEQASPRTSHG